MFRKNHFIILCVFLISILSTGCHNSSEQLYGEYAIEDIVYVGGVSSLTIDALKEKVVEKNYVLGKDYFKVTDNNEETTYSSVSYEEVQLTEAFIESEYDAFDNLLMNFFYSFDTRKRYNMYTDEKEKVTYCVYLMDDELYISKFAKSESIIFAIEKLKKMD